MNLDLQKPEGIEDVKKHFKDFCSPEEIVVIGDRYFTDILFGNSMGSLTIKTDIITPYGENSFVKMVIDIIFEDIFNYINISILNKRQESLKILWQIAQKKEVLKQNLID